MASSKLQMLTQRLPAWMQDWLEVIVPGTQILLIVLVAWLIQRTLRRLMRGASARYQLPDELVVPINGLIRWLTMATATLLVLERLGVSATVLWTAFTGFATVGAVAFFAAWSVLSNLFCALLIFTVRPFRVGDCIEVLDTAEKPGAKGRVVDINLLYTTLQDLTLAPGEACLQIPNAIIFQRVVRRFNSVAPPATTPPASASEAVSASPAAVVPAPSSTP
ncbi:MAG: mechanosensitive ion channel family protein [Acidovorax sp.]|jgi:small-conductance mechanosensitive channel